MGEAQEPEAVVCACGAIHSPDDLRRLPLERRLTFNDNLPGRVLEIRQCLCGRLIGVWCG